MPKFGRRVAFIASLVLLLLLALAQVFRLAFNEETELRQATLQSARCQRVVKIALILKDVSIDQNARLQAVSELQNTLPAWEKQQSRMQSYQTASLSVLVVQTQADFAAMDTAAWSILANPTKPADPVQVGIILQREHNYTTIMTQLATLVQQRLEEIDREIITFEQIVTALLFIAIVTPPIWGMIAGRIEQKKSNQTASTQAEEKIVDERLHNSEPPVQQ